MKKSTITILFITTFLLAGCGIKRPIPIADIEKIDKVGLISLMGNKMQITNVGFTVFDNSHATADIPDWKIDDYIESKMTNLISDNTNYTPVIIGRKTKNNYQNWEELLSNDNYNNKKVFYDSILAEAKEQGISYIFMSLPAGYDNSPHTKPGYGLKQEIRSYNTGACPYRQFVVEAFKINHKDEYEQIGWEWGFDSRVCVLPPQTSFFISTEPPVLEWKPFYEEYANCQKVWIENAIKNGFDTGLRYALSKLRVIKGYYSPPHYTKLPCVLSEEEIAKLAEKSISLHNNKEEPVTIGLSSCPNEYDFSQSCSFVSGATQRFKVNGISGSIAATADGYVIYVDSLRFGSIEYLYRAVREALESEGVKIIRVRRSVTTFFTKDNIVGFALELDQDGYSLMKKYFIKN